MKDWKDPSSLGFILSLVLHGIFFAFALWGLFVQPSPLDVPQIIPVDIMTLGPQTRAPRPKPVPVKSTPKSPEKKTPPAPKPPEPETKPVIDTREEPTSQPEAVPLPEKKAPPKPAKRKEPAPKKKEAPKPSVKKPSEKPKKKPAPRQEDSLDSLLKEVESESSENSPLDSLLETDPDSTSTARAPSVGALSISERDFIQRQIKKFWNPPPEAVGKDVRVSVILHLDIEGRVQNLTIERHKGTPGHPLYQVTAETVTRALQDPEFTLPLPQEKYEEWKTMTLNVSPEDF